VGGKVVNEIPVGEFLWFILFDAIHHRASSHVHPAHGRQGAGDLRAVGRLALRSVALRPDGGDQRRVRLL